MSAARTLWDLAADAAIAKFLHANVLTDVLCAVLATHERHRPRLTELCAGCLANMASASSVVDSTARSKVLNKRASVRLRDLVNERLGVRFAVDNALTFQSVICEVNTTKRLPRE